MTDGLGADRPELVWLTEQSVGWQFGEQGILVALANVIKMPGQCVEIGAGDGEQLPLTIEPFYKYGLECVLYEKDPESLKKLQAKYLNANMQGEFVLKTLSVIAEKPLVCVIDVDSIDSVIMDNVLLWHQPKILMVEHFDKCHEKNTEINQRVPEWLLGVRFDGGFTVQDNAETLKAIAEQHNYTLLGTTRVNSIFVHDSLVEKVAKHVPS